MLSSLTKLVILHLRQPVIYDPNGTSTSKIVYAALLPTLHLSQDLQLHPRTFRASIRNSPARRSYASGNPNSSPLKIWPFVGIIFAGSGAYALMVKSRVEMAESSAQIAAPKKDTPTFSPASVTVIFVLGGPGAGKGTQCANLVRDYHFTHLSAGDLLRAEQVRAGSEFGELIKSYIKEGKIVPMEVTVQLLENAMQEVVGRSPDGKGKFLIDGFPRQMDQAVKFEEAVCPGSGRSDDNAESIKKRFKTFVETSMPVVDYFKQNNRVIQVVATKTPEEVYAETKKKLEERLGKDL
ncbi:hypothetical protein LZ554_002381 [Drepanopeziza brunnea f. sp. 'monogermtubi']|nr:hypothetical protein LZ554_002381 [Drepanopeziza brunnea f. sp. 'monogermtubi']